MAPSCGLQSALEFLWACQSGVTKDLDIESELIL